MGRITSSIGLITGTNIEETVDKLVSLSAQPRDRLTARQKSIQAQQVAVAELTSLTIGVKLAASRFGTAAAFAETAVTSSNASLVSVKSTGTPRTGQATLTPIRTATAQQSLSSGVADAAAALGGGTVVLSAGGTIASTTRLDDLRGGAGVARGSIRLIDRSGEDALVDLTGAVTIDDVVAAINGQSDAGVTAKVVNDRIVLADVSGGTGSLRVTEVAGGRTAADLGLAGINASSNTASGAEIAYLSASTRLTALLDGRGVTTNAALPELSVSFTDGSPAVLLNFSGTAATVDDLLATINAADPARLEARIAADGDRIELVDKTGQGLAGVAALNGSDLGARLGLTTATGGAVVRGARLHGGLAGKLTSTLSGGGGLGTLGSVTITDRAGASATVDLSAAETLDDVAAAVAAAGVGVKVGASQAGTGLALADTSGGTGTLTIVDADATGTAGKLGLTAAAGGVAVGGERIEGANLHAATVFRSTKLTDLPGGRSVALGRVAITDTAGHEATLDLAALKPKTVGEVIDAINALGLTVTAGLNATGDGIALTDATGGAGAVTVADLGGGRTAADLRIAGTSTGVTEAGQTVHRLDGSFATTITLDAGATLEDLAEKINDADAGLTAAVVSDGSPGTPYRLVLTSAATGRRAATVADLSDLGLTTNTIVAGRDAVLRIGGAGAVGGGLLLSSGTNTFADVLPGVEATVQAADGSSVQVAATASQNKLVVNVKAFVDQVNKLRDKLDTVGAFNPLDGSRGVLNGSGELLRIESGLTEMLTRTAGTGSVKSLRQLGVDLDDAGKLSFDETKFRAAAAADPAGVEAFFTAEATGFVDRVEAVSERLNGVSGSALLSRSEALQRQYESLTGQISAWNTRLDSQRNRLLKSFYQMELVIGQMQSSLSSLSNIQSLTSGG